MTMAIPGAPGVEAPGSARRGGGG